MASERLIVAFGVCVVGVICGGGPMLLAADLEQLDAVVSADFFLEIVEEFRRPGRARVRGGCPRAGFERKPFTGTPTERDATFPPARTWRCADCRGRRARHLPASCRRAAADA
jgi:hypothetical protein